MVHISPDFSTKKAFKEAVAAGRTVEIFSPGPFPLSNGGNGLFVVEAPASYHRWYAKVQCTDCIIKKVVS